MFQGWKEVAISYRVNEYCLNCGACMDICPEGAIIEGEEKSSIDPGKCNECGICIKNFFCPAQAIGPDKAETQAAL